MAQAYTDVYKANMEVVRQGVLPRMYELNNYVSAKILGGIEKHAITKTVNSLDFRAPIETGNRAQFGTFSMAGGSLGLGGSFTVDHLVQTAFPVKLGFQINKDTSWGTANAALSRVNAFKKTMKDAIPLWQRYDDVSFFNITGSQGVIGVSTALDTLTYTMDTNFGANLILPGQVVEVVDSTLATNKTLTVAVSPDNLPYVSAVNKLGGVHYVTIANTAALTAGNAPAAGDRLCFQGVGATPAWMNGLYYVNDSSTSGSYLGITKSTNPQIVSNGYDMNGTLTPQAVLLIQHRIFLRYGELPKDLVGIMNVAQHAAILNQGINISNWFRKPGGGEKMLDIMPEVSDVVDIAGVPCHLSPHSSQTRLDFVKKSDWGRVTFGQQVVDFYTDDEGRRVFPLRSSNGAIATADLFYLYSVYNYYNINPGAAGYIYNCSLPDGYGS